MFVDIERFGPSTGLPTRTSCMADLGMLINAGGESPKVIIAPGLIEDNFIMPTILENISQKVGMPVIFYSDLWAGMNLHTIPGYNLQRLPEISLGPRADLDDVLSGKEAKARYVYKQTGNYGTPGIPGYGGIYRGANYSLAHSEDDADGRGPYSEHPRDAKDLAEHHQNKYNLIGRMLPKPEIFYADGTSERYSKQKAKAKIGIITAGSVIYPVLEAQAKLAEENIDVEILLLRTLWPLSQHSMRIARFINAHKKVYVAEQNVTGQLMAALCGNVQDIQNKMHPIRRYDGRMMTFQEVYDAAGGKI